MKISCFSDSHEMLPENLDSLSCDLLLIAGDILPVRFSPHRCLPLVLNDQASFFGSVLLPKLKELAKKFPVVFCAGNHDFLFEHSPFDSSGFEGLHYLQDSSVTLNICGKYWKIFGTPRTPYFHNWAFNSPGDDFEDNVIEGVLANARDADILISHGPPRDILDLSSNGQHCGSLALRRFAEDSNVKCKLNVFGHIHEGHGFTYREDGRAFANVAISDLRNKHVHPITNIYV